MKRIAVYVATTGGPVLIQRITPEYAPQSMICLGRSSEVLPISGDYDDFVKLGSGIIMREFGPFEENAFRLDASGPIGTGRSWQLGVFTAHSVEQNESSALSTPDEADVVLWMTGMVDYDLHIKPVDHIAEKANAAQAEFARWLKDNKRVYAVVPKGNNHKELLSSHLPDGVQILPANRIKEVLNTLNLINTPPETLQINESPKPGRPGWALFAVVAVAFAVILFNLQDFESDNTSIAQAPLNINTEIPLPAPTISTEEEPLEILEPEKNTEELSIELYSKHDDEPVFNFGDHLEFTIEINRDSWLNCFYFQADGTVLQLYPNPYVDEVFRFEANVAYHVPSEDFFPFKIRLAPPAGEEVIACFATEEDITPHLPDPLKGETTGPLPPVIAADIARIFHSAAGDNLAIDEFAFTVEP
ncbi:MAG: DUF4384 domain-containing protein [Magnetovibrio sp.]|nr:DUF4384 domain-containing protein [Magnetovibrio sp.]